MNRGARAEKRGPPSGDPCSQRQLPKGVGPHELVHMFNGTQRAPFASHAETHNHLISK